MLWASATAWLWWQHRRITTLDIRVMVASYAVVIGLIVGFLPHPFKLTPYPDQGRLHPGLPFMLPFQRTGRSIREIPDESVLTVATSHLGIIR